MPFGLNHVVERAQALKGSSRFGPTLFYASYLRVSAGQSLLEPKFPIL